MNTYDSLIKVLSIIENRKFDKLSISALAHEAYLSTSHLQRVFKLTCGQSLMNYVRGRKLAHSLDELLYSDMRIIDIAVNYGFQHEQSYIRAFSKEYGCTPGEARDSKLILPIRERIAPGNFKNLGQGFLYGPEIVRVRSFNIIGKPYSFFGFDPIRDAFEPNRAGRNFYYESLELISNVICPEVYIGVCSNLSGYGNIEYMPCLQVKNLSHIPDGFKGRVIPPLLCARFRYIGNHHPEEINMMTAQEIYAAKINFLENQSRYVANNNIRHFEIIDSRLDDGAYCQMELVVPVEDTLK